MNFTCNECNDTGSIDKSGDYLDCTSCEAPAERMALESFIEKLPACGGRFQVWQVHQRALAMAPKQEAPIGYISSLALIELQDPDAPDNILTLRHSKSKHPRCEIAVYIDAQPAPAAANGALTDEQIGQIWKDLGGDNYPAATRFARAILAAAGPDAALVKALEKVLHVSRGTSGRIILEPSDEADIRAALSGAKGN